MTSTLPVESFGLLGSEEPVDCIPNAEHANVSGLNTSMMIAASIAGAEANADQLLGRPGMVLHCTSHWICQLDGLRRKEVRQLFRERVLARTPMTFELVRPTVQLP